jgi:hypothetical protein
MSHPRQDDARHLGDNEEAEATNIPSTNGSPYRRKKLPSRKIRTAYGARRGHRRAEQAQPYAQRIVGRYGCLALRHLHR